MSIELYKPQPHEVPSVSDLDPTNAQLVVDYMRIADHPAVRPLLDIDLSDSPAMGQINQQAQQFVLYRMFVQGVMGNREDFSAQKIMDTDANNSSMQLTLRSINEFHNGFTAYTTVQHISSEQQAENITMGNLNDNITLMTQDIIKLYQNSLVDAEGESSNLQYIGQILRFMNANLLFSEQLETPGMVDAFYDKLYEIVTGEAATDGPLNKAARNYAEQYGKPITRGSVIKKIRRQAGSEVAEVTNRAALMLIIGNAKGNLQAGLQNPGLREKYASALHAIGHAKDLEPLNTSIVSLTNRLSEGVNGAQTKEEIEEFTESVVQSTQLDWEVLPPGELEAIARSIIDAQKLTRNEVRIDLERLNILAKIREEWGEDVSYYVHGTLGKRRIIKRDTQEEPDQYLLLILQDVDEHGTVLQEHAVAESPIAGPHALYVFRQDVSEGLSWREVMALPKKYARDLGARAVKHTQSVEAPASYLVPAMTEKVRALLACEPQEFPRIEFDGKRGFRLPSAVLA